MLATERVAAMRSNCAGHVMAETHLRMVSEWYAELGAVDDGEVG
jgi:hypothetical protein